MSTTASEARHDVEEIPGLDELAAPSSRCGTPTRPSGSSAISARSASWRPSLIAGRSSGCSRRESRIWRSPSACTRARQPSRAWPNGCATVPAATSSRLPHPVGHMSTAGRPPARRHPLERADGAPSARAPRRGGPSLRGRGARTARALPERAGRPLARPAARHPRVRPGRGRPPGITGANLVAEAEADVVRLADLGFARCTLEAAVPVAAPQQAIADLAACASRRHIRFRHGPRSRRRASRPSSSGLGVGRGGAAPRSLGGRRRSRLHRLDGERERSAPDRRAALVGGRADRESDARSRRRELVERLQLMLEGVVVGPEPPVRDAERGRGRPAARSARSCPGWARRRCCRSPSRGRSPSTRRSRSTRSGSCFRR